ncbi:unnamed protein product [Phytophthora fragariaefolia]|uniref:Unnamed protein product n=1 Tax=Phytophthora fragariaefolia TaxID=1490495 RepID=A0A9W6TXX0_9STRA|nr:unnamed protein product [Phytophthora fragariaefolia]
MAGRDDAAALRAHGESASDADQSLRAPPATATASAAPRSAERRGSAVLKLARGDSAADALELDLGADAEAEPNPAGERSVRDQGAIVAESSTPSAELQLSALRLELDRVRQTLEEEDGLEINGDTTPDGVAIAAGSTTASAAAVAADDDNFSDAAELRVFTFGDGVYRGQARLRSLPEPSEWEPHGLGVLTTVAGHAYCGQWLDGKLVGHGTSYGRALHYEGDVGAVEDTAPHPVTSIGSRHGVGFYMFGSLFVGCWEVAATLPPPGAFRPRGHGSLRCAVDALAVDGWCHGLRCAHQCPSKMDHCSFRLPADIRRQSQPLRGLLVAEEKLQFWCRRSLKRALSTWSRLCCEFSIAQARRSRLLALNTQAQARRAEQRAIRDDIDRQKTERSQGAAELLELLAKCREAQEQRSQRRQLYAQRLTDAIKQRDLAQACVVKQQSAVKTLEQELQEIVELLTEARQAQGDCARYARELHVLKWQVENASVKINAIRFDQQHDTMTPASSQLELQLSLSQRSVPPTPMKKTPPEHVDAANNNSVPPSRGENTHRSVALGQQFVCDVPGCMCGIPRDVFLRVGAALNDE